MFYLYILQSEKTGRFYTGSTGNVERRVQEHNSGQTKSTRTGSPWTLIYSEPFESRSEAVRMEREIKRWKSAVMIRQYIENRANVQG